VADDRAVPAGRREARSGTQDAVLGTGLVGALVLAISQFLPLAHVHVAAARQAIGSITAGSEHAYALLPVAVLAALLAYGVWVAGSRPALLAVGVMGLVALLIALIPDLSYAHSTGLTSIAGHFVLAGNRPAAGFYLELAGAMILLITCVSGFVLIGAPERAPRPIGSEG
jgi:hypothetical protein